MGMKKMFTLLLCALLIVTTFGSSMAFADSESEITNIPVTKNWEHKNNEDIPESITLKLMNGNLETQSIELKGDESSNTWTGEFSDVPLRDSNGNVINYTVKEVPVEGYETTVTQQPVMGHTTITGWDKIEPNDTTEKNLGVTNFLVSKKGNALHVWTLNLVNESEMAQIKKAVNSVPELSSYQTIDFVSGSNVCFDTDSQNSTISINIIDGNTVISYEAKHTWSLLFGGVLGTVASQGAVITNTFIDEPTVPTEPEPEENYGSISVEKFVTGTNAPKDKVFYVSLFNHQKMEESDRVKTLPVKAGDKAVFDNLYPGSYYLAETDEKGEILNTDPDYQPFFGDDKESTNKFHASVAAKTDTYVKLLNKYKDKEYIPPEDNKTLYRVLHFLQSGIDENGNPVFADEENYAEAYFEEVGKEVSASEISEGVYNGFDFGNYSWDGQIEGTLTSGTVRNPLEGGNGVLTLKFYYVLKPTSEPEPEQPPVGPEPEQPPENPEPEPEQPPVIIPPTTPDLPSDDNLPTIPVEPVEPENPTEPEGQLPPDDNLILEPEKPAKPIENQSVPDDEGLIDTVEAPVNPDLPKTGDAQNFVGWMSLMLIALAALGVTIAMNRKENE